MSPGCTAYQNAMRLPPLPLSYVALRGGTVASASVGAPPATSTASLNSTAMAMILPVPYVPSSSGEETLRTAGRVSIVMPLGASELGEPGSGSVALTGMPPAVILPPLRDSARMSV